MWTMRRMGRMRTIPIILIGAQQDQNLAPGIMNSSDNGIFNAMGIFSIRQSAELIRQASLLISNDSAPTHLGVAVETLVITIFGSTVPAFGFFPYGKKNSMQMGLSGKAKGCSSYCKCSAMMCHRYTQWILLSFDRCRQHLLLLLLYHRLLL